MLWEGLKRIHTQGALSNTVGLYTHAYVIVDVEARGMARKLRLVLKVWRTGGRIFLKIPPELAPEFKDLAHVEAEVYLPDREEGKREYSE